MLIRETYTPNLVFSMPFVLQLGAFTARIDGQTDRLIIKTRNAAY